MLGSYSHSPEVRRNTNQSRLPTTEANYGSPTSLQEEWALGPLLASHNLSATVISYRRINFLSREDQKRSKGQGRQIMTSSSLIWNTDQTREPEQVQRMPEKVS